MNDDEWKELRDETAEEVSWLAAGFHSDNAAKVKKAVTAFLDRGHRLRAEELNKQWPALEKAAQQLVGSTLYPSGDFLQTSVHRRRIKGANC